MLQACVYRVSVVGLVVACGCAMSACSTMGSRKPLPSREASVQSPMGEVPKFLILNALPPAVPEAPEAWVRADTF